jgi:SAM-dependent methyltransferase
VPSSEDCILCNGRHTKRVLVKGSWSIVKCEGCGLVSVSGHHAIGKAKLKDLYDKNYFTGETYNNYIDEYVERARLFNSKFSLLKRHLPRLGRLLDVGAATGFFLDVARRNGYEVFGIEISEFASAYAREHLNLNVITGQIENARFPSEYFDIITMWDVLEHLPNPVQALQHARRLLKPSGILVIETLDVNCLNARILRGRWPLYTPPLHLFYFSKTTLGLILSRTGFRMSDVIPIQTYSPLHKHRALRYLDVPPIARTLLGLFLGDVIIALANKA